MDASEIYSKRLNAKEVIFTKQGEFIFPIEDGRIKTPGRDQDLRTSTLVRHRPIQGEGHNDFLGELEGSLPQPHDSLRDAGEAMNDFWSMSGNFIFRHLLIRIWMSSKRSALMIIGTLMALETCLILGQVSHNLLYSKKNLLTAIHGPGRD